MRRGRLGSGCIEQPPTDVNELAFGITTRLQHINKPFGVEIMKEELNKLAAAGKIRKESVPLLDTLSRTGFVVHRSWGFGRIKRIDLALSQMTIDFRGKPGHMIDLDLAAQILKPSASKDDPGRTPIDVQRLNWKLLPPGELNLETLRQQLHAVANVQRKSPTFDTSRLEFLLSMKPSRVYAGLDEFDGYLAFLFSSMDSAVLENPMEGNAIYVFDANWRELSKLSKMELFLETERRFCRIVHSGDWQNRLKAVILSE